MRDFITKLYFKLNFDTINSCADDKAMYVEVFLDGKRTHIKLTPSIISYQEYDTAWDFSAKELGEHDK